MDINYRKNQLHFSKKDKQEFNQHSLEPKAQGEYRFSRRDLKGI